MAAPPNSCWALSDTIQDTPHAPNASILLNLLNLEGSKERRIQCRIVLHAIFYTPIKDMGVFYECIFRDCKESFENALLLVQHLLICPMFHKGGIYWCYKCKRHHTLTKCPDTAQLVDRSASSRNKDTMMESSGTQTHPHSLDTLPSPSVHHKGLQALGDVSVSRGKAAQIKEEDWNNRKDQIHRLYITDNLSLDTVMRRMKEDAGFEATKRDSENHKPQNSLQTGTFDSTDRQNLGEISSSDIRSDTSDEKVTSDLSSRARRTATRPDPSRSIVASSSLQTSHTLQDIKDDGASTWPLVQISEMRERGGDLQGLLSEPEYAVGSDTTSFTEYDEHGITLEGIDSGFQDIAPGSEQDFGVDLSSGQWLTIDEGIGIDQLSMFSDEASLPCRPETSFADQIATSLEFQDIATGANPLPTASPNRTMQMAPWDVYCPGCGCPFGDTIRVAKMSWRRQEEEGGVPVVLADGQVGTLFSDSGDGYNPEVITEVEVQWARDTYIIACRKNELRELVGPAFISGPCSYSGYGSVDLKDEAGNDPNFDSDNQCYFAFDGTTLVYPFHKPCLEMLAWVLTGTPQLELLDKDRLYKTLHNLPMESYRPDLDYNFGGPNPYRMSNWFPDQGMEFLVANPLPASRTVQDLLRGTVGSADFVLGGLDLSTRVRFDPFRGLPYDLMHEIFGLLSAEDLVRLATASWPIHFVLRSNSGFWTLYAKQTLPWFPEFRELLGDSTLLDGKSLTKLFCWADKATIRKEGMTGPLMSIANRRRIWGICEQISPAYFALI
ncbi:hypothetical protein DL771_003881 [Monosporascus sp. 5C6A]|nr:hypothetical protein DL771_003881 [Monosporascus sp. 5C6A]